MFYMVTNQNADLAEKMLTTLENPAGIGVDDPFFRLRCYFTADHTKRRDPIMTIALCIKACNYSFEGRTIRALTWRYQGTGAEDFPVLKVRPKHMTG